MGRPKGSLNKKNNDVEEQVNNLEVSMTQTQELESLETEMDKVRLELEKTKRELEEKKAEVASAARRDIDKKERELIEKQVTMTSERNSLQRKIEEKKIYDSEMVTGKFMNRRAPGQPAKLTYLKYEEDPVKWYNFEDGKVYTIPRGFADQINEYYHTPIFTQKTEFMDPERPSSAIHEVDTSNKKYAFVPVNF